MAGPVVRRHRLPLLLRLLGALVALFLALAPTRGSAQPRSDIIRAEVGGPGLIYTVNYEHLFPGNYAVRIGFGFLPRGLFDSNGSFALLPLGVHWFWGSRHHRLELGGGLAPIWVSDQLLQEQGIELELFAAIGYRYFPSATGLTFAATFTPIWFTRRSPTNRIVFDTGIAPYGGLSVGYVF